MAKNLRHIRSVAFVSGKGGVGKTSLATNFAYVVSSARARVLLVDMDFDNMGCTGVFAANYQLGDSNSKQMLMAEDMLSLDCHLTQIIEEKLWFLPASLFVEPVHSRDSYLNNPSRMLDKLKLFLLYMEERHHIDCIIFDCHGGIDAASIACAGVCDYTLIITEPDSVTFAGTLGIFDAYSEYYKDDISSPNIRYIVNRISPKLNWKYLDSIYTDYLNRHLGQYSSVKSVLAYIANESFIAETFGSYPFQVKLAPKSLYTRKIELMVFQLFISESPNLVAPSICKMFNVPSKVQKIYRRIMTNETTSVIVVMRAFGLPPIVAILFGFAYAGVSILGDELVFRDHSELLLYPFILYLLYSSYGLWHCTIYIHEKLTVQKGLLRNCPQINTGASRLNLWKLRIFRSSTFLGMILMLFYALLLIYIVYNLFGISGISQPLLFN